MSIADETMITLVEEREELQARNETLYDALTDCYALAKRGRLPDADHDEALEQIAALVRRVKGELEDMLNAAQYRGMHYELLDEEAMAWYEAVERQFHLLTPEGKRRAVAARKREEARHQRDAQLPQAQADARISAGEGGVVRSLQLHKAD